MLFLFGVTPALYGIAMLRSTEHRAWVGWVGVFSGMVGLAAAAIQVMSGQSWLAFYILFPFASIATTLWIIYLGFCMWRVAATAPN